MVGCQSLPKGDAHEPPTTVMTRFYDSYFRAKESTRPAYSESFAELLSENAEVCREIADATEVCGFGVDVDPFLDAREANTQLNLETAKFFAKDAGQGVVDVEFDLRPPERSQYHHRKIRYVLKVENGRWVIDDIQYGTRSARAFMLNEIQELRGAIF